MTKNLRIAVFYDWLNQWGGAERLLLDILQIFPQATVFTSVHHKQKTPWLPKNTKVNTSFFDKIPIFKDNSATFLFLQPLALEQLNFSNFDIVISLTSMHGKCLLTPPTTLHICYCLTPNRYIYLRKYPSPIQSFVDFYKKSDYIYAQRPDYYLTISQTTQKRITRYFHRQSTVVYPGVDTHKFKPTNQPTNDYFLVVSRLVHHKKIDLAIRACQLSGQKLKIVGTGRDENYFKSIVNNHTEFLGQVAEEQLISLYQNCQALICPQIEDFGLVSLESQACGRPVLAYNKGGIAETVINQQTGLLFGQQNVSHLSETIKLFLDQRLSPHACRQNAVKFSQSAFMLNFENIVTSLWQQHRQHLIPKTTT